MAMASNNMLNGLTSKLEGAENFTNWKYEMESIFTMHGLYEYVIGTVVKPEKDAPEAEKALFTKNSNIALSIIKLSIGLAYRETVRSAKSPKEAWDSILRVFDKQNREQILYLKKKLYNLKMKGSLTDFLLEMKAIRNDFLAIDVEIEDSELNLVLTKGLTSKWGPYVGLLELSGKVATAKFEEMEILLKQYELELLKEEEEVKSTIAAMVANQISERKPVQQQQPVQQEPQVNFQQQQKMY